MLAATTTRSRSPERERRECGWQAQRRRGIVTTCCCTRCPSCGSGVPTPRSPDVRCGPPGLRSLPVRCASPSWLRLLPEPGSQGMDTPSLDHPDSIATHVRHDLNARPGCTSPRSFMRHATFRKPGARATGMRMAGSTAPRHRHNVLPQTLPVLWVGSAHAPSPDVRCGPPGLRSLPVRCASPSWLRLLPEPGSQGMDTPSRDHPDSAGTHGRNDLSARPECTSPRPPRIVATPPDPCGWRGSMLAATATRSRSPERQRRECDW